MKSTFKKILCPIDFSEDSFAALRAAYTLALCFSAHLIAVHVMPSVNLLRLPNQRPVHHRIVESYFAEQLDLAVKQWTEGNVQIDSMLLEGYPADEIVRVAGDLHVDAIVMAEQRKDEWERLRDGSTTEEVLGNASCPVLVLREIEG